MLDAIDHFDHVRARLALDVENDRGRVVGPRGQARVLRAVDDVGDVRDADWRAVLVGDDQVAIFVGRLELIVRVDRRRPARSIEAALRLIDIRAGDRHPQVFHAETIGGESARIDLYAHGRTLAAAGAHETDAGQL